MVELNNSNFLFIISAPSGTGKTTLCRYLLGKHKNLVLSISATTRKPRKKEIDGFDYFFISKLNKKGILIICFYNLFCETYTKHITKLLRILRILTNLLLILRYQ